MSDIICLAERSRSPTMFKVIDGERIDLVDVDHLSREMFLSYFNIEHGAPGSLSIPAHVTLCDSSRDSVTIRWMGWHPDFIEQ